MIPHAWDTLLSMGWVHSLPKHCPRCIWLCWEGRISPGGGEEGWLHSELCWASQTLPAVIVQLIHSAFLMGKHRW